MKIVAKDGMPFYKGVNEGLEFSIGEESPPKFKRPLTSLIDSITPISIFGPGLRDDDADSKIAYSPFENKPFLFKTADGDKYQRVWQAGRYVGATQIEGKTIEIRPRFGEWWLLYFLEGIFHFKLVESDAGAENKTHIEFNELMRLIFWHLWVNKFASADQYGLPKRAVKLTHTGIQILGHVNVRKSLFPLVSKGQVVSEYREKEIDDDICRIVYKAYGILVNRSFNKTRVPSQIQDSLNNLYGFYQGRPVTVSQLDYLSIGYKDIYLSWKPIVDFSWQIIQQDSFFNLNGIKGKNFSIFFDMAEIWEVFLRKKLGDGFVNDGWRVWSVEECRFHIYKDTFYGRQIIPDIIIQKEHQFMVFDAKYKRMNGSKTNAKDSDVDRSDLFQIHTYIQFVQQNLGEVVIGGLLYPITQDLKTQKGQVDTSIYHSNSLFGSGKSKTHFIVDGIYCSEEDNRLSFEMKVQEMINRIKKYTN